MKKGLISVVIIIIVLLIGSYFYINRSNEGNVPPETTTITTTINNGIEAIARVREISQGLPEFITKNEDFGPMKYSAKFYEEKGYWHITFWPEDSTDYWYIIHLDSSGNVLYEGEEMGG
jgi:hypothetical protein